MNASRRHVRRNVLATLVAGATLLTGTIVGAAPASAVQPPSPWDVCPNGSVCIWADANGLTGNDPYATVSFSRYIPDYGGWRYKGTNIGSSNTATSIINDGISETAYMYANTSKRDRLFSIPRGNVNWALWGNQGDNIESGYYHTYN